MLDPLTRWLLVDTPVEVRIVFFVVLAIAVSALVSVITLAVMAARSRRRRGREHPAGAVDESDYLWVFMVPALNEEVTIADSVGRLLQTQATNRVILAINDGSDDRTAEVLQSLACDELHVLTRVAPQRAHRQGRGHQQCLLVSAEHDFAETPLSALHPRARDCRHRRRRRPACHRRT